MDFPASHDWGHTGNRSWMVLIHSLRQVRAAPLNIIYSPMMFKPPKMKRVTNPNMSTWMDCFTSTWRKQKKKRSMLHTKGSMKHDNLSVGYRWLHYPTLGTFEISINLPLSACFHSQSLILDPLKLLPPLVNPIWVGRAFSLWWALTINWVELHSCTLSSNMAGKSLSYFDDPSSTSPSLRSAPKSVIRRLLSSSSKLEGLMSCIMMIWKPSKDVRGSATPRYSNQSGDFTSVSPRKSWLLKTAQCWWRQGPGRGIAMFIVHNLFPVGTHINMYHVANISELYPSAIHGISQPHSLQFMILVTSCS